MRYLHTMLRVRNLDAALDFYCNKLGLTEVRRRIDEKNKYTLVPGGAGRWRACRQGGGRPRRPHGRAHLQLERRGLRRSALLRPSRIRGRRHLRAVRQADAGRSHHQPSAARRHDGVRALARPALNRAVAERRSAAAEGAVGLDAQYRALVKRPRRPRLACRLRQTSLYVSLFARRAYLRALGALRLAVQDIALSRRKHGFDSRRARQLRLRMRQKCNAAEQTTEALA
jgi:catechol 2,3-dioxygenase-like lactoylglutathione lyase family enzyme